MIDGMANGTTTRRTSAQPCTPKLRAASTTRLSTLRTPFEVLRYMGNNVASPIKQDLGRLADAEPDDEEEDDGGVGNHAQHLHGARRRAPRRAGSGPPRCRGSGRSRRRAPGRRRRGGRRRRCRPAGLRGSSSCTKACQVACGVDRVVEGMTPVAVRIHQAAKIDTGTIRRSATDQRRGRRPTSPTGSRTSPGTGVAASVGAPLGAGAAGPIVSSSGRAAWSVTRCRLPCRRSC